MQHSHTAHTTPTETTRDDVHQGERRRGMPTVLAVSTGIAALALFGILFVFLS